jgi:signal peptidase II
MSNKLRQYFLFFVGIVLIDRLTKWWAVTQLSEIGIRINQFISFELAYNRGVSWGMFSSESTTAFVVVSAIIGFVMILLSVHAWMLYKQGNSIIGHIMALAGAMSNMIDRFYYGGVVDFILLSVRNWSWPLFNIADSAIVLGVLIIIIVGCREC